MPLIPKKNTQKDAELKERERLRPDAQYQDQGEVSEEFLRQLDSVRKRYRKALKELASR